MGNLLSVNSLCDLAPLALTVGPGASTGKAHQSHAGDAWNGGGRLWLCPRAPLMAGADTFSVDQPEPGDYYVVQVLEALTWGSRVATLRDWDRPTRR